LYINNSKRTKLTLKQKTQLNSTTMSNDNGNRRHRTEHNKKKNIYIYSLFDNVRAYVCMCVCET